MEIILNELPDYVFYHRNCFDGTCSAWLYMDYLREKYPGAVFADNELRVASHIVNFVGVYPGKQDLSKYAIDGKKILFLDVVFEERDICKMQPKWLVVIDHHKSNEFVKTNPVVGCCIHEQHKCAAELLHQFLYQDKQFPWWLTAVADVDMWRGVERSTHIMEYAFTELSANYSIEKFEVFTNATQDVCVETGKIYYQLSERRHANIARGAERVDMVSSGRIIRPDLKFMAVCGHNADVSAIGHHILQLHPTADVAVIYKCYLDTTMVSMRSRPGDVDLTGITDNWPHGGGHKCAAGLQYDGQLCEVLRKKPS